MSCDQVHKVSLVVKECVTSAGQQRGRRSEKRKAQVFPFVDIALRLFMTLPVANASGGRSSSKWAVVKDRLRPTMGQNRLNHPSLICPLNAIFCANWILPASLRSSLSVGRSPEIRGRGSYGDFTLISVSLLFSEGRLNVCVCQCSPSVCVRAM